MKQVVRVALGDVEAREAGQKDTVGSEAGPHRRHSFSAVCGGASLLACRGCHGVLPGLTKNGRLAHDPSERWGRSYLDRPAGFAAAACSCNRAPRSVPIIAEAFPS